MKEESTKIEKYENQEEILGERNSYSKTDHNATFMRMKNDETLPTYNLQVGTQNGFVTLHNIVYRYIKSYNELRSHQEIANAHPSADASLKEGRIKRRPILFGLYQHYYRDAS